MIDLSYVKTFGSINEAGRELNISPEAIRQAILKGTLSTGFYWKYEGTDFIDLQPDKKHSVIGINVYTGKLSEFESAREAERITGAGHTRIMKCCNKDPKYKTAGGYYWFFKGDETTDTNVQLSIFEGDKKQRVPLCYHVGTNKNVKKVAKISKNQWERRNYAGIA